MKDSVFINPDRLSGLSGRLIAEGKLQRAMQATSMPSRKLDYEEADFARLEVSRSFPLLLNDDEHFIEDSAANPTA